MVSATKSIEMDVEQFTWMTGCLDHFAERTLGKSKHILRNSEGKYSVESSYDAGNGRFILRSEDKQALRVAQNIIDVLNVNYFVRGEMFA